MLITLPFNLCDPNLGNMQKEFMNQVYHQQEYNSWDCILGGLINPITGDFILKGPLRITNIDEQIKEMMEMPAYKNWVDFSLHSWNEGCQIRHLAKTPLMEEEKLRDIVSHINRIITYKAAPSPIVVEAIAKIADYQFKIKAPPIVHNFFQGVTSNLMSSSDNKKQTLPSINDDIEKIILSYL